MKAEKAKRKQWEGNRLPAYHLAALDRAPRYSHLSGTERPLIGATGTPTVQPHVTGNEDDRGREEGQKQQPHVAM